MAERFSNYCPVARARKACWRRTRPAFASAYTRKSVIHWIVAVLDPIVRSYRSPRNHRSVQPVYPMLSDAFTKIEDERTNPGWIGVGTSGATETRKVLLAEICETGYEKTFHRVHGEHGFPFAPIRKNSSSRYRCRLIRYSSRYRLELARDRKISGVLACSSSAPACLSFLPFSLSPRQARRVISPSDKCINNSYLL